MKSVSVLNTQNSFSKTVDNQRRNSHDIEAASYHDKYTNEDLQHYKTTSNNIILFDNILLNKYYNRIKSTCTKKYFGREDNIKYRYRPEALASDVYGIPGLWYLILKVNSCEDCSEFTDFDYVLMPDLNIINDCLTNEEYMLKKQKQKSQ